MKVMGTATFKFLFKNIETRDESYKILKQFLAENDWIDENGRKRLPLDSFHSEINGECEVILADNSTSEEFADLIDELFESIKVRNDIKWIKTHYNVNTFNIVHKEAGKYLRDQAVDLSNLNDGDKVYVYISKG